MTTAVQRGMTKINVAPQSSTPFATGSQPTRRRRQRGRAAARRAGRRRDGNVTSARHRGDGNLALEQLLTARTFHVAVCARRSPGGRFRLEASASRRPPKTPAQDDQ
jgi:hypothetical protein